ncbi:hypothetical protein ABIE56_000425 [Luteibacter sp. 621]|uniref:hypothetical protein n=1 Tax=Luteibacter sp. 621 TaxID=3373916 RepID=UPI003D1A3D27
MNAEEFTEYFARADIDVLLASEFPNERNHGTGILLRRIGASEREAWHFASIAGAWNWWRELAREHFRNIELFAIVLAACRESEAAREWVENEGASWTTWGETFAQEAERFEDFELPDDWSERLLEDGPAGHAHGSGDFFIHLGRYREALERQALEQAVPRARCFHPTRVSGRL